MRRHWVIRAGARNALAALYYQQGIVGLSIPWKGDALETPRSVIASELRPRLGERASGDAAVLKRFAEDVAVGDVALTPAATADIVLVGRIAGPYRFEAGAEPGQPFHCRDVVWITSIQWASVPAPLRRALGAPLALYAPAAQVQIARFLETRDIHVDRDALPSVNHPELVAVLRGLTDA